MGKCQQSPCSPLPTALPVPLPAALPVVHEPMLLLTVTEFVANSAAFTYFTAGALRRNISGDMVGMCLAAAVGQSCPRRVPLGAPAPTCALWHQQPDPSAAFQLPRRFPLQLRTKSLGLFSPQVGTGGMGHGMG